MKCFNSETPGCCSKMLTAGTEIFQMLSQLPKVCYKNVP